MTTPSLRLAPDGATIDRWAEFIFDPTEELRVLFSCDQEGYIDAVWQLVQTIAGGGDLVTSKKSGKTAEAAAVRKMLEEHGRLVYAEMFREDQRTQRLENAYAKLDEFWEPICRELNDFTSEASNAFLGHMRREFHYSWRRKPKDWEAWYSPEERRKELPQKIKVHILHEIIALATEYGLADEPRDLFGNWIEINATTHYRIFFEYFYSLDTGSDGAYMPALTRSSLPFIKDIPEASVTTVVLPFVALEAIKKVTRRKDLIPLVTEWSEGPGRAVSEGLKELQNIIRSTQNPGRKKQILSSVERTLSAPYPRALYVVADLLKFRSAAQKGEVDLAAIEDVRKLAWSNSYRWLWSIRSSEMKEQWRAKIRELSQSPD